MPDQPPHAARFAEAQASMAEFFAELQREPELGQIHVRGVRYMLMRTDSMAIELHEELRRTFGDAGARQIRYKLAKACGRRDARMFAERFEIDDAFLLMSLGPAHFTHVGWASVTLLDESTPQPNEDFFLAYTHPYSFEAASYIDNGLRCEHPVCHMNAGYSTGWGEATFGVDLQAEELTCRARGEEHCLFVMAHPSEFSRRREAFCSARGLG